MNFYYLNRSLACTYWFCWPANRLDMAHENYVLLLSFCLILWCTPSCKKVFEYTPYSAQLANGYDEITTEKNIQKISGAEKQTGSFKIAILADSHYFIDELAEAVNTINSRNDIAFTIVAGDMSDQGLEKEYMQLYDQLKRLKTPLFTVIGNHDYLANAEVIYAKIFGPYNYSFRYNRYNFIFFDAVFWEKNGQPDYNWLDNELAMSSGTPTIIVSHIPPFGDQLMQPVRICTDLQRRNIMCLFPSMGMFMSTHTAAITMMKHVSS